MPEGKSQIQNNKMGLIGTIALVVSGMVGCGILILPHGMAKFGTWGFVSCFLASYMAYCIFQSFVNLRIKYISKNPGSNPNIIDFLKMTYCDTTSFLISFGHFTALTASCSAVALALAQYYIPLYSLPNSELMVKIIAVLSLFVMCGINFISAKLADYLNQSLNVIKLIFFLFIAFCGSFYFKSYTFNFVDGISSFPLLFSGAATAMFTFMGIEFAVFASDSIDNPETNIPKGTLIGLAITTLIFFGVYAACSFVLPELASCETPVSSVASIVLGKFGSKIVEAVAVLSCMTSLNGCLVVQGNSFRTFANKGFVPSKFAYQTSSGFPYLGALLSAVISSIWIGLPFLNSSVIQVMAVSFVAMLYLAIVIVDLNKNGIQMMNVLALISSFIMLSNLNYSVIMIMIIIYASAYLLKCCVCKERNI